jgi:Rrf2 family cysteine metabolism transcriptional repressor
LLLALACIILGFWFYVCSASLVGLVVKECEMRISTRSEYGLRALMELGVEPERALSLRDIANRQHISLEYLEQLMPALKKAGLVRARRGAQGGYQLTKGASEITVYDIMTALEGTFDPMQCLANGVPKPSEDVPIDGCGASGSCAVQEVWRQVKNVVEAVLKKITLAQLIERQQQRYGGPLRTYSEHEIMRLVVLN